MRTSTRLCVICWPRWSVLQVRAMAVSARMVEDRDAAGPWVALDPNMAQRVYFSRAAGTAQFAWNWALGEWKSQYKAGVGKPTEVPLRKQLNALKRENFPWMYDVGKAAVQEAIIDLGSAFRGFFDKRTAYPRFKRKEDKPSFCAANEARGHSAPTASIKLPVIGWVRMREAVQFTGPLKRATVVL